MDKEKVLALIKLINTYVLPLAEQGAKMSKTDIDNLVVTLLKGGLPAVEKFLEQEQETVAKQ